MYGYLIQWLRTLANGRLVICEQGANNNSVYRFECLLECSKALLGKPTSQLCAKNLSLESKEYLQYNVKNHIDKWKSLQF